MYVFNYEYDLEFYEQHFLQRNNGSKKFSGNIGIITQGILWDVCRASHCITVGITYAVEIVDRQTKIIWRSGKSPIIIIPRMPQFPNATMAFSGNACVTCSSVKKHRCKGVKKAAKG